MKPDEWMPLNVGHYLRDTARLTRDQHGAYLLLLFAYWTNGGAIPADDAQLAATVKATRAEWRRLKPVLAPYFQERDGLWFNKRADLELARARDFVEKKQRAGKAGADSRWQTYADANGKRMAQPLANGWQTDGPVPIPSPDDELTYAARVSVPEDFPDQENRDWAEQHWREKGRADLCALIGEEAQKFRDYNIAGLKTSADWSATWRMWVRAATGLAKPTRNGTPKAKILTILDEES